MPPDPDDILTGWQRLWSRRAVRILALTMALCTLIGVIAWSGLHPPRTFALRGWNRADHDLPEPPPTPPRLAPWFEHDPHAFADLPLPSPGDWLWQHEERGQSFKRFVHERHDRPSPALDKLYILPIGEFSSREADLLEQVATGCEAYLQMPVILLEAWHPEPGEVTTRETPDSRQWLVSDILEELPTKRPDDGYALLGVTMMDIWPGEGWNYVFGQASWATRVGVQSFARYDPAFGTRPGAAFEDRDKLILARALQVMTHEFGHMFGLRHCIDYACNLNGSNSLEEADTQPTHLCPNCLKKLHHAVTFDPARRYQELEAFYTSAKLDELADWVKARRQHVAATADR